MKSYRAKASLSKIAKAVERPIRFAVIFGVILGSVQGFGDVGSSSDFWEARQFLGSRKWDEAAIALRSVLRRNPDFTPAAIGLATALAQLGRREEALSTLVQAANHEKGPRRDAVVSRLRVISRIFLRNATYQAYQDGLNIMLARKYRPAFERFAKTLEQEPDHLDILIRLGQCLILDNDYDSAAERLRLAKRLNPFEPEVRLWLGRALHYRGELSEAVDELRIAQEGLPESELAPLWLSDALYSLGQKNSALQVLQEDTRARPMHISALVAQARIKMDIAGNDTQLLWSARKDLQLAASRLAEYASVDAEGFESELGFDLRPSSEQMKLDIQKLQQSAETRIAQKDDKSAK